MDTLILVPEFNRLSDWTGLWAMEPRAWDLLVERIRSIDLAAHMGQPPPAMKSALEKIPARGGQSIGIIKVMGTMMKSQSSLGGTSTVQLRRDIRQAAQDPEISSILMAFDTPGGTTAGTDDFANEIKAARRSKKVVAHVDDLCASAGYWGASQCEEIYANSPTALVGNVGTFTTVFDSSEAAKLAGVKAYRFATGPLKGAGTPGTVLTEQQQAYFQALTNESQVAFDTAVRRGRGLTDKQMTEVRSGAIYTAENAQARGLIDGIRSLSKTLEEMTRASAKPPSATSGFSSGALPMVRQTLPMRD